MPLKRGEPSLVVEHHVINPGDFIGLTKAIKSSDFSYHLSEVVFFYKLLFQEVTVPECELACAAISIMRFLRKFLFNPVVFKKQFF